jgi:hypothetical protein
MNQENAIRKEISASEIEVSRVFKGDYQKPGTMTAELKQTVTTISHYPSQVVVDSLQDNIFDTKDFGFKEQSYDNKEVRVAWIDVPEGMSAEQVKARLESFEGACLYKILSNRPILSDRQQHAINNPELPDVTMDTFANSQATRYGAEHENAGNLVLDRNGKIQYRGVFFSTSTKEDQDLRTADVADFYASDELQAELTGSGFVVGGQEI